MICFHGTTRKRAIRICEAGFEPRKPSRRVWFARGKGYAERRARTQAHRAHDQPVVLTCDLNLQEFRRRYGAKRVMHRNGIIAIDGPVPVTVLRSHPVYDHPGTPQDLARWVNHLLRLKQHKGVSAKHPGIGRLSQWVMRRQRHRPNARIKPTELLELARQWLPDYFRDVAVDLDRLHAHHVPHAEADAEPAPAIDPREEEALDCLAAPNARRRVRGLHLLAELGDPDLVDWCTMFLHDEAVAVRVAALRMMRRCDEIEPEEVEPLAESASKRVRAAAIATLACHGGDTAPAWFERGLKDPSACVRQETARLLDRLDPETHHAVFDLARYDPNPAIAHRAKTLIAGKGYADAAP